MNSRQIFEDILLLDQSVTLSFNSRNAFNSFRNSLHTVRQRINSKMRELGMEDVTEGKSIQANIITETPEGVQATFSLVARRKPAQTNYQIISIDSLEHPEPTNDS